MSLLIEQSKLGQLNFRSIVKGITSESSFNNSPRRLVARMKSRHDAILLLSLGEEIKGIAHPVR
jgi:hypothetical protein